MKTIELNSTKIILMFFLVGILSCDLDNYLDVEPKNQISDAAVWNSETNADLFLNDIYSDLPSIFVWRQGTSAEDPEENFSDNSMNGVDWRYSRLVYAKSSYTPSDAPNHWFWYTSIRKCNLFIEKVASSNLEEAWKENRLAEVRFLRAFFYQMLWTRYGGVPIITGVLDRHVDGDAIFNERASSDEVFEFITAELGEIAPILPINAISGRITRGAALTLKGWVELFQASPLKNPKNDLSRWALSAETNKQVMELEVYDLFPDYGSMFLAENNNNSESIFVKRHEGGTAIGGLRIIEHGVPYVNEQWHGDGSLCPTQELVDAYLMDNGKPITDPKSGYDPQNPYVNREQRFYQTVIYNGSEYAGDTIWTWVGSGSKNTLDLASSSEATNTGYYIRKGLNTDLIQNWNQTDDADYIIFRYAEVLLNFAEARNEANGPDGSVYGAINKVRERSELPPLKENLTKDEMRQVIRRERRVELAFEEKRWLDLLRWKTAEIHLNGSLHAMKIEKNDSVFHYETIPAPGGSRKFFAEKNYVLPIPQSAMDRNTNLIQNPNY